MPRLIMSLIDIPALTVSSCIVGTTMGRTFSAVPYTYLKHGVYCFEERIFPLKLMPYC